MEQHAKSSMTALTLGAIGVVYGDIGTSVLYALKEVFGSGHVEFTPDNVYGILSIFFWTLTTIVSIKYVMLVLRADNNGEGGLVAMLALASQSVKDKPKLRKVLLMVGIFGTCLFYGDGVITPAISVLSAVEGLEVVSPTFKRFVIPITLLILLCLFAVQKRGTSGIGKFFGPITLVWFIVIAMLGVYHIVDHPEILWAVSPHYAAMFVWDQPFTAFIILGAVVLCVTGGEALYADMGHFGKKPIRLAWFSIVMPCLTLNYFGQGALLLAEPEAVKNPFYNMAPDWALIPLVILATAATVIASQALITGAFSVTKQVIQLGFLPRLQILHTSEKETGQIYMPLVNWGLAEINPMGHQLAHPANSLNIRLIAGQGRCQAITGIPGFLESTNPGRQAPIEFGQGHLQAKVRRTQSDAAGEPLLPGLAAAEQLEHGHPELLPQRSPQPGLLKLHRGKRGAAQHGLHLFPAQEVGHPLLHGPISQAADPEGSWA